MKTDRILSLESGKLKNRLTETAEKFLSLYKQFGPKRGLGNLLMLLR